MASDQHRGYECCSYCVFIRPLYSLPENSSIGYQILGHILSFFRSHLALKIKTKTAGKEQMSSSKRQTEHLLFLGTMLRRWGWRACSEPAGRTRVKPMFSRVPGISDWGFLMPFSSVAWSPLLSLLRSNSAQRSMSHILRWAVWDGQCWVNHLEAKPNLWPQAEFAPESLRLNPTLLNPAIQCL